VAALVVPAARHPRLVVVVVVVLLSNRLCQSL
jgi:hypothetical protein